MTRSVLRFSVGSRGHSDVSVVLSTVTKHSIIIMLVMIVTKIQIIIVFVKYHYYQHYYCCVLVMYLRITTVGSIFLFMHSKFSGNYIHLNFNMHCFTEIQCLGNGYIYPTRSSSHAPATVHQIRPCPWLWSSHCIHCQQFQSFIDLRFYRSYEFLRGVT